MIILWFRQDLRLADNPALQAALDTAHTSGAPVLPLYNLDDESAGQWKMGGASRWWLHHSLASLQQSLHKNYGLTLHYCRGNARTILQHITAEHDVSAVYWNRCYEPWRITRDTAIKEDLKNSAIETHSFNASLLYEPHTVKKKDGTPYKVFTPFYRKGCLAGVGQPRLPEPAPKAQAVKAATLKTPCTNDLNALGLMPKINWYSAMAAAWQPGEAGAQTRLQHFLDGGLCGYKDGRNHPDKANVSRLSPHLHFGELSPHQAWHAAQAAMIGNGWERDGECFLSELGWREFSHYLLYHFPQLPTDNLQTKFDAFPWNDADEDTLRRWQRGLTGYPIVDAGMRELWQTGYMHNRVRMVVGSFLVKHLRLHWHHGEHWFWDTLLDADLANNSASWQWIAGCGADAAPYFRIFNPITQGKKFDSDGAYVRRFIPELAKLPNTYLHEPWNAPDDILTKASIKLGDTYPRPIVNHSAARESALSAFSSLKTSG